MGDYFAYSTIFVSCHIIMRHNVTNLWNTALFIFSNKRHRKYFKNVIARVRLSMCSFSCIYILGKTCHLSVVVGRTGSRQLKDGVKWGKFGPITFCPSIIHQSDFGGHLDAWVPTGTAPEYYRFTFSHRFILHWNALQAQPTYRSSPPSGSSAVLSAWFFYWCRLRGRKRIRIRTRSVKISTKHERGVTWK